MREGRSGRVVAVGNPGEADFLRVQPTGSKDTLAFSPAELTLAKPARRSARNSAASRGQGTLW
ncbi:hypothetical protein ACQP1G_38195 [Nocardia sp. CA-107356]|uniref:hypothetical protein n=1 Tax=Nocardia sp. CA-107356 TaxID=3239972 RepID=UPI003D8E3A60